MGRHDINTTGARVRPSIRRLVVVGIASLGFAACASADEDGASDAAADDAGPAATAVVQGGDAVEAGTAEETAAAADEAASRAGGGIDPGSIDPGTIGRDVIVEMRVSMSSDDIRRSVGAITARAAALGGGVASSDVNYGDPASDEPAGYAVLVVKVPPVAVADLVAGLDDTGTVRSVGQSAQDVSEQLVDLDVRIDNARASVANVREFMDRTEDLSELVALEAELSRRQTELEQLEAQQRNLSDRVALATVTIEIVPSASVPAPDVGDDGGIADAFADGWEAFVAVLLGIAFVLAVLAPFLAVGVLIGAALWWLVRHRRSPVADPVNERDEMPTPTG